MESRMKDSYLASDYLIRKNYLCFMKIKVLLFGISTDLVGESSLDLNLNERATVKDFKNALQDRYPSMDKLNSYAIAVNESYASDDTILNVNDIVAIIPPVSGG